MFYEYRCSRCGTFWAREEEAPIISVPFYNPHRSNCPNCGREKKGSLVDFDTTSSNLDEWGP